LFSDSGKTPADTNSYMHPKKPQETNLCLPNADSPTPKPKVKINITIFPVFARYQILPKRVQQKNASEAADVNSAKNSSLEEAALKTTP
jgi:hypothetical protein